MFRALLNRISVRRDPIAHARRLGATIGDGCRLLGDFSLRGLGSEPYLIEIGNHVTVTDGVRFVTHDGAVWIMRQRYPDIETFGRIRVGDNVFIGLNAIILPGVCIGSDAVIAAGAVVTRDVPAGTVVSGTPARVHCSVQEYEERVLGRALHVRSLTAEAKRRAVLEHLDDRG